MAERAHGLNQNPNLLKMPFAALRRRMIQSNRDSWTLHDMPIIFDWMRSRDLANSRWYGHLERIQLKLAKTVLMSSRILDSKSKFRPRCDPQLLQKTAHILVRMALHSLHKPPLSCTKWPRTGSSETIFYSGSILFCLRNVFFVALNLTFFNTFGPYGVVNGPIWHICALTAHILSPFSSLQSMVPEHQLHALPPVWQGPVWCPVSGSKSLGIEIIWTQALPIRLLLEHWKTNPRSHRDKLLSSHRCAVLGPLSSYSLSLFFVAAKCGLYTKIMLSKELNVVFELLETKSCRIMLKSCQDVCSSPKIRNFKQCANLVLSEPVQTSSGRQIPSEWVLLSLWFSSEFHLLFLF